MYKWDDKFVDDETYIEYLESTIIYAKDVIDGKYNDILAHRMLPIENAIKNIRRN